MTRRALTIANVVLTIVAAPGVSFAEPAMLAKAKALGMPARTCQYCHTAAMPKKDTFKPDDLNARGAWLLADKEQRKLDKVDLDRLKDFPGGPQEK